MTDSNQRKRGRWVATALFALFFAPIVVSFFLLEGPFQFRPMATSNRGTLIQPAKWISSVGVQSQEGERFGDVYLQGLWTLLYVQTDTCSDVCKEALYKTRQSWKALNQNQPRVQRAYFSDITLAPAVIDELREHHPGLRIGKAKQAWFGLLATAEQVRDGMIIIIDPEGLALMYYHPSDDARGIIKDMKRLLKLSKIG